MIKVEAVNPHHQDTHIANTDSVSARYVTIDGNRLIVMVYGDGPTVHMNQVLSAIDAMEYITVGENHTRIGVRLEHGEIEVKR